MKRMQYTAVMLLVFLFWGAGCTKHVRTGSSGGHDLGTYRLSVYWLAHEKWFKGRKNSPLYSRGKRVALVSERFSRAVRLQGSGILRNGWLVQYRSKCRGHRHYCLNVRVLSRRKFPLGVGAAGRALKPLRSLAVDTRQIAFGTKLYIPVLGRIINSRGYHHNGCFVAHDRGGRIKGARIDLFAGNRGLYRRFLRKGIPKYVQVYINHPKCRMLR